jgi:regulator of RNase E activity RraA
LSTLGTSYTFWIGAKKMRTLAPGIIDRLSAFDTPTICNLVELFEVRPRNTGYLDGTIRACFPELPPMSGYAATATFRAAGPPRKGDVHSGIAAQVERFGELSGPPIVVFQDLDDPAVAATFGEVMCSTYQAFGAVGLVTSGAGRDLAQVRELGLPVFARGTICAHGYCHTPDVHVPVHVGGIVIYPDDLLHGDLNGVTTIPKEIATDLVDIGDEFLAAEAIVLDALRDTRPTVRRLRAARAESQARIASLREQVSRAVRKQ